MEISKLFTKIKTLIMPTASSPISLGMASNDQPKALKQDTVLEKLMQQFDKANVEQSMNCERLMKLKAKLNNEPHDANIRLREDKAERLVGGEGMLSMLESMVGRYQETIAEQNNYISTLEKLL